VASAVIYTPVANLTALAALTPTNGDYFELTDSTGAESSALITGVTVGLVGAPGLTFRLRYDAPPGIFTFLGYFANDSETRYLKLQGGTVTGNLEIGTTGSLTFEGSTANAFETTVAVVDPTADRTITLPNVTGTVVTTGDTGSVTNTMLAGSIDKAKVTGTAITAADTGTVTSTMILDGTIVDGDVNASAAIAGTKISPNFGSQNVVTTGTSSAAALIPTGSSVPTNGTYLPAANAVAIATNSTERLRIDSSGRLGLGTTTPNANLHVKSGTDKNTWIYSHPTYGNSLIGINDVGDTYTSLSIGASPLIFRTAGGTEAARIDSSGRLGIGNTGPGSYNAGFNQLVVGSSGDQGVTIVSGTSNSGTIAFADGTSGADAYRGYVQYQHGSTNALVFATDGSERFRCDSSGRLLVGTTTATANGGVLELSGGITFPATAVAASNANTLDDYEEGTWTPVFNATGATFTTTSNVARYTKVGNQVTLVGYCQIRCSAGSGANPVTVTGLPFATPNIGNFFQGYLLGNPNIFNGSGFPLGALIQPNTSTIDLKKYSNNSGVTTGANLNSADMTDASFSFQWSITYWSV
jgi:hypothetical protein